MKKTLAVGAIVAALLPATLIGATPANAASHALIQGSGSSWAANAINQWIADVHSNGLQVVFTSNGSAQGRKDFANNTVDYAVSDIGYQGTDPATGQADTSQGRAYAYLPVVAGGTSFPYQIRVGGQLVRNLRLSGQTLAKIFTNKITNWNDPAITADNNGHALPSLHIIPVTHSEGSGSTYQFTRYLTTEFPSIWNSFAGVGATEYFPQPTGSAIAENGSDGVVNFLTSSAGNGAIGYDEYSYALGKNYPVAKVLNSNGYYTLPNQYNVAVALTQAQINTDKSSTSYLLQNLDKVYTYNDPRVYPMSSYSYMVIPTGASPPAGSENKMTTAKRQTLADYLYYSICQGQKEMGPIGYSPLPINLVQAGFDQIGLLHSADGGVDLSSENVTSCNNPTFVAGNPNLNYLAQIAPQPPACDKQGAGPCTDAGNTGQQNPTSNGSAGAGAAAKNTASAGASAGASATGTDAASSAAASSGGVSGDSASKSIDPVTGQEVDADTNGSALGSATVLASSQSSGVSFALGALAVALLLALLIVPPLIARRLDQKRSP